MTVLDDRMRRSASRYATAFKFVGVALLAVICKGGENTPLGRIILTISLVVFGFCSAGIVWIAVKMQGRR